MLTKTMILVLPLTALGLFGATTLPQTVYSQTDYEEYLIVETNTEQKLNQQNIGSGSSTNINCGTNTVGSNLQQPISCPSVPGETPTPGTLIPVVTQRSVTEVKTGSGVYSVDAPCNSDEVVTGGGWEMDENFGGSRQLRKEFAVNNAWHIETIFLDRPPDAIPLTMTAYAECLKLVPAP